jgi:ribosomal protein S12 methylthiotransferase accessory factor
VVIFGARSGDGLGRALEKLFPGAQFAEQAVSGVVSLAVNIGAREVIIGPLTLPGRAGCWHCAQARMAGVETAARAMGEEERPSSNSRDSADTAARALIDLDESRLLDHLLIIDAETERVSFHRVIPLAECPVCGGAAAYPQTEECSGMRLSEEDSPESVLAALGGWVDQRTGIVSRLILEVPDAELVIATAAPPHLPDANGAVRRFPIGWGKGLTISGALLSAVGEAIERYAPSLPDVKRFVWARPDELDGERLDPREFALYTAAQYERGEFPFVRFDPEIRHPWVLGKWFASGGAVWTPAVFAYLSLPLQRAQDFCQGSSNGLAAAWDWEEAALRATLELVERDAFMTAWAGGKPGQRVEVDDPQLRCVVESVERLGATVESYVLPSAWGTTVLCLAFGDGEQYPGATIGLSAALDVASAMRGAVLELAQTGPHLRRMMQSGAWRIPERPEDVREMPDHAAYYFPAERASAFNRLRTKDAPVCIRDLPEQQNERSLLDARVALVDVTSADVATGPFRVVRAISPDLRPISYGYGLERAGSPREIHPIW